MFGCLAPSTTVYASNGSSESGSNFLERVWDKAVSATSGFISNSLDFTRDFIEFIAGHRNDYGISENEDPEDWLDDNISVGTDGNIVFSDNVINSMRDCINNYIVNSSGYSYVYSCDAHNLLNKFDTQEKYGTFLNFISDNDGKIVQISDYDCNYICVYDANLCVFKRSDNSYYSIYPYNSNWELKDHATRYIYNSNTKQYELFSNDYTSHNANIYMKSSPDVSDPSEPNFYCYNSQPTQFIMYYSVDAMRQGTTGVQPYYVNNNFNTSHITGSYNTTTSDINNAITYNNVSDYVNNYYIDNGSYPTTTIINNYINNYTGGNGGSGGDDDDNKPDWDFGFLGTIADLLAELISGLGDIVGGILSAITSILTSLREGIPNTIGLFLEWFFPFLPSEIVGLIELSILCMVIIGVIRLIRGH